MIFDELQEAEECLHFLNILYCLKAITLTSVDSFAEYMNNAWCHYCDKKTNGDCRCFSDQWHIP